VVIFAAIHPVRFKFDLGARPTIVQCGLTLHGSRATELGVMHGLWSLHAYHYHGELRIQGEAFPFRAGSVSLIPPEAAVEWHFPSHAPHYYVHFAAGVSKTRHVSLPLLRDMGEQFDRFCEQLEELIRFHGHDRLHAEVRLWDLLCQLNADRPAPSAGAPLHPSLQMALSFIRNRKFDSLAVGEISRAVGVSNNHLTQVFKAHFGCGVREFIQRERISRACHLLLHSSLSIKSIAIENGISSLQYFNKLIRQATGLSPSAYRKQKRAGKSISQKPARRAR